MSVSFSATFFLALLRQRAERAIHGPAPTAHSSCVRRYSRDVISPFLYSSMRSAVEPSFNRDVTVAILIVARACVFASITSAISAGTMLCLSWARNSSTGGGNWWGFSAGALQSQRSPCRFSPGLHTMLNISSKLVNHLRRL
jgi:hypothetical protein